MSSEKCSLLTSLFSFLATHFSLLVYFAVSGSILIRRSLN